MRIPFGPKAASPRGALALLASATCLACLFSSCRLLAVDACLLRAPPLPGPWAASGFVVGWVLDADGESLHVEPEGLAEPRFRAGQTVPFFLRAQVDGSPGALAPLGGVWPHCLREEGLEATAAGGWVATVCALLRRADPGLAAAVDWARLERELAARLDDPWTLDPARAAERLAQGAFTVSDLRRAAAFPLALPFDGPLPVAASPAATAPVRGAEGRLVVSLSAGQHLFLAPGLALRVAVDGEGAWTACLERAP